MFYYGISVCESARISLNRSQQTLQTTQS